MLAHYFVCDSIGKRPVGYRNQMREAVVAAIRVLKTVNLTQSKLCIRRKVACFLFENLCAPNKVWNLREMLRFSDRMVKDRSSWTILRTFIRYFLAGNNVEIFLTIVEPHCPPTLGNCRIEIEPAPLALTNATKDVKSIKGLNRRKRAFDPQELMLLFKNVVCEQEIVGLVAEYYERNYKYLGYSRVWTMKNMAVLGCCLAENLAELFNSTPDKV